MVSVHLWLMGAGLSILLLLTAATHLGLRTRAIVHVAERLQHTGRDTELRWLTLHRDELSLATATLRAATSLALTLVVVALCESYALVGWTRNLTAFFIAFTVISVVGVALPTAVAKYASGTMIVTLLPGLKLLHFMALPLVVGLGAMDGFVRRLIGVPARTAETDANDVEREILSVVSEGELQGTVDEKEREMIESVMEFGDTDVGEIMTPRTDIIAIEQNATLVEAKNLIAKEGHSRIPVYEETIDNTLGVLYAKDLLRIDSAADWDITQVMRSAPYVPDSKPVGELLQEFKDQKIHIAIVLDEYGGTAGLVTIEDILEELVGEIADEYEESEPEPIQRIDNNAVEVDARLRVDVLNHELNLELPEHDDYETIGGFVFCSLGRIPRVGEQYTHNNVTLSVVDAEERRINRLRLDVAPQSNNDRTVNGS